MDFLYIFLACYMKLQRVTSVLQENFCKIGKQQAQTAHNRPQEDKKSTQQGTQTQESTANKATATPARFYCWCRSDRRVFTVGAGLTAVFLLYYAVLHCNFM